MAQLAHSMILASLLLWQLPCSAQELDPLLSASARTFFQDGLAFADKRQWDQAADRFRRALSIRWSTVLAYNLASVLDEVGDLIEAVELLHQIERDITSTPEQRRSARELRGRLEPRLARLRVSLTPASRRVRVLLDGKPLLPVQIGAPIPADPGEHELVVVRDGKLMDVRTARLAEGGALSVELNTVRVPTPEEVARAAQEQADLGAGSGAAPTDQWWFWAGVGTVVAGAIAAGVALALDQSTVEPSDTAVVVNALR